MERPLEMNLEMNLTPGLDIPHEVEGKYLTFWMEEQLFGIPVADVVQIINMMNITPVPEFPMYAKGIISLRGSVIPIIDVRLRLGKMEVPYTGHTCIIVVSCAGHTVGCIVDSVDEVAQIDAGNVSEPPVMEGVHTQYLTGVAQCGEKVVLLLDTTKLLGEF